MVCMKESGLPTMKMESERIKEAIVEAIPMETGNFIMRKVLKLRKDPMCMGSSKDIGDFIMRRAAWSLKGIT
jgi:hypothetical protein